MRMAREGGFLGGGGGKQTQRGGGERHSRWPRKEKSKAVKKKLYGISREFREIKNHFGGQNGGGSLLKKDRRGEKKNTGEGKETRYEKKTRKHYHPG